MKKLILRKKGGQEQYPLPVREGIRQNKFCLGERGISPISLDGIDWEFGLKLQDRCRGNAEGD